MLFTLIKVMQKILIVVAQPWEQLKPFGLKVRTFGTVDDVVVVGGEGVAQGANGNSF